MNRSSHHCIAEMSRRCGLVAQSGRTGLEPLAEHFIGEKLEKLADIRFWKQTNRLTETLCMQKCTILFVHL